LALSKATSFFRIISVRDGREVIQYLSHEGVYADREKFPDPILVLLDLTMPVMNGFDVLRWMREHPKGTMPPVFALSYSTDEHDVRLAYGLGVKSYLIKSVELEGMVALLGVVDDFLRKRLLPDEAPHPCNYTEKK